MLESAQQKHKDNVTARDSYQFYMKKEGITGRADYEKQVNTLDKVEAEIPEFKSQIQSQQTGLNVFDTIAKGIEQAGRDMQMEQDRQQQKVNSKSKTKKRQRPFRQ